MTEEINHQNPLKYKLNIELVMVHNAPDQDIFKSRCKIQFKKKTKGWNLIEVL